LSFPSENSKEPKIIFVKNLHYSNYAICLYWIDEIHIDEGLKNSPILNDIIRHELKHYYTIKRLIVMREQGKILKPLFLAFYNNLWDIWDSIRIELKWMVLKCKNKK